MITTREVYETMGKQFATAEKAIEYREGLIEAFFRETPGFQDIPARQKIAFVDSILNRRAELATLLNYSAPNS
jgi:hypothetical protein